MFVRTTSLAAMAAIALSASALGKDSRPITIAQTCSCSADPSTINQSGSLGARVCKDRRYWQCRVSGNQSSCSWQQTADVC